MNIQKIWEKANAEHDFLFGLFERWLDEWEFEDLAEYLVAIQAKIPEAVSIHRPFGILCKGDDGQIMIDVLTNGDKIELRGTME